MALILPSISATLLRRNFHVRSRVNEIEKTYERPHVNVKVERARFNNNNKCYLARVISSAQNAAISEGPGKK